jgi:phosphoglycolate phosphatase-like HAD superfamily hydrolase
MPKRDDEKVKLAQSLLPDSIIRGFKENGVNSNWDIAYAMSILARSGKDPEAFLLKMKKRGMKGIEYLKLLDEFDPSEKHDREGGSWGAAHKRFQACYLELEETDEPVMPLSKIKKALDELKGMGLKLGIVTGRPLREADKPLKRWGLWDYFDRNIIVTDDDVDEESKRRGKHVGKPDPWPILRAIFKSEGCSPGDAKKAAEDYVLVGDSVSDVLAAKNAGIKVICVKTGIASEDSLRKAGGGIVVKDITDVPGVVKRLIS